MYRIGEFAKITNLSIRTLRFYNDLNLLVPEYVDVYTNYRYYGDNNLEEAKMIEKLKDAGFTLDEIKTNLGNFTEEKYLAKKQELYKKIYYLEEQIKLLDKLRANENSKNETVKVKKIA